MKIKSFETPGTTLVSGVDETITDCKTFIRIDWNSVITKDDEDLGMPFTHHYLGQQDIFKKDISSVTAAKIAKEDYFQVTIYFTNGDFSINCATFEEALEIKDKIMDML